MDINNQGPYALQSLPFTVHETTETVCIGYWRSSNNVELGLNLLAESTDRTSLVARSKTTATDWNGCFVVPQSSELNYTLEVTAFSYFSSPADKEAVVILPYLIKQDMNAAGMVTGF